MDRITFLWDELINDDSLTARIYRGSSSKAQVLGRGFISEADSLSMTLEWTNAGGFLEKIVSEISDNMKKAQQNLNTMSNIFSAIGVKRKSGGVSSVTLGATKAQGELYQMFDGFTFKVSPKVNVYFISDDDNSNARDKCIKFVKNFLPAKTSNQNLLWTLQSNTAKQELQFGNSITVSNGFSLVIGGPSKLSPSTDKTGKELKQYYISGNGSRVYTNLVVEDIQVEKTNTIVKLSNGQYAPLFYKATIGFVPIATLEPSQFTNLI